MQLRLLASWSWSNEPVPVFDKIHQSIYKQRKKTLFSCFEWIFEKYWQFKTHRHWFRNLRVHHFYQKCSIFGSHLEGRVCLALYKWCFLNSERCLLMAQLTHQKLCWGNIQDSIIGSWPEKFNGEFQNLIMRFLLNIWEQLIFTIIIAFSCNKQDSSINRCYEKEVKLFCDWKILGENSRSTRYDQFNPGAAGQIE